MRGTSLVCTGLLAIACGGDDNPTFSNTSDSGVDAAAGSGAISGASGVGGATGGTAGSGGVAGATGGTAGSGGVAGATGGTAGVGGSSGTGGASGGTGGATGGTGGASGGTGGATGGTGGASGGTGGASGGTGGASGGTGGATGGTGGATGGTGGGTGGAPACDTTTSQCVPTIPVGWAGPIAFYEGAGPLPVCPGKYPSLGAQDHSGFVPGSATCGCSCDPAKNIACTGNAVIEDVAETAKACLSPGGTTVWSGAVGQCTHPTAATSGQVRLSVPAPSNNGTCDPKSNHTLPTPKWSNSTQVCEGSTSQTGTCTAGDTCVPKVDPPYQLCYYRPGNFVCPVYYTLKTATFSSYTDTRSCSACSCGAANSSCGGQVAVATGCSGGLALGFISGCGIPPLDVATNQFLSYQASPSGTCSPSASTLSGAATPTGEMTVCCLE
ncbi:MAG: hypothetical protein R3B13_14685 [Polyangiaceae bacterium]